MSLPSTELELLESISEPGRPPADGPAAPARLPVCADLPPVAGLGEWGPRPRPAVDKGADAATGADSGAPAPRAWWQRLLARGTARPGQRRP